MEHEQPPTTIELNGERFTIVKPERLNLGMVLRSTTRPAYARLGEKQAVLSEQIHTVSLGERGFPVARVLDSGPRGETDWYFIEEDLGEQSFHTVFRDEYGRDGVVSNETFAKYFSVLERYFVAQYDPKNRTSVSANDFLEAVFPEHEVTGNYYKLGGDVEKYRAAIAKATARLADAPMGILQFDLNPYNIMEHGVIDFEMVGYGPLGYDAYFVSRWHRWFVADQSSRYSGAYMLSEDQIAACDQLVEQLAVEQGLPSPSKYHQEFAFIKTAWGFSSHKNIDDEPASKRAFYQYRAELLVQCVDNYLADMPIDPLTFPWVTAKTQQP